VTQPNARRSFPREMTFVRFPGGLRPIKW
jgi:hypothetical protein